MPLAMVIHGFEDNKRSRRFMSSLSNSVGLRAAALSVVIFSAMVALWWLSTMGGNPAVGIDPEYAKLMGATVTQGKSAFPSPGQVGSKLWEHIIDPFYDRGPNDKGIGIQLAFSI